MPSGLSNLSRMRLFLIQRLDDVPLQRREATLPPQAIALSGIAVAGVLGLLGQQRGDGEDFRAEPQQALDIFRDKGDNLRPILVGRGSNPSC